MNVTTLKQTVSALETTISGLWSDVESARLAVCAPLFDSFKLSEEEPEKFSEKFGKWIEWSEVLCPGENRSGVYRLKTAGELIPIVGGMDAVGKHTERHLEPLGRLISGDKTEEERTLAEKTAREVWEAVTGDAVKKGIKVPVSAVVDAVDAIKPRKPSKGKQAKSPTAPKTEPTAAEDAPDNETVDAARATIAAFLKGKQNQDAIRVILAECAKFCDAYGAAAVLLALATPDGETETEEDAAAA